MPDEAYIAALERENRAFRAFYKAWLEQQAADQGRGPTNEYWVLVKAHRAVQRLMEAVS